VVAAAATAAVIAAVTAASVPGGGLTNALSQGLSGAAGADRWWLLLALVGFGASIAATAGGWRSTLTACGGRVSGPQACARYGVGSLLNTLLPGRLGEAVRVRSFSRALPQEQHGRTLTTVGVLGAVTLADTITQSGVVGAAAVVAALPAWSFALLVGAAASAGAVGYVAVRRFGAGRLAPLLDAFRTLAHEPGRAARVFGWLAVATAARVLAAVAVAASLGLRAPFEAGLVMCAVVIVATALPLTPGNLGVTSGAIVLALHSRGAALAPAMAAGIVFHAAELLTGLLFGAVSALALLPRSPVDIRRRRIAAAGVLAGALLVTGVGAAFAPRLT
jgi:putative heme transporter